MQRIHKVLQMLTGKNKRDTKFNEAKLINASYKLYKLFIYIYQVAYLKTNLIKQTSTNK